MSDALYPYYEEQLHYIRREAEEFAKQYPAAAGQLLLERNQSRDPHVERLIEAFALLSARVEKKLDDEFPEITDGLLSTLYPQYLAPIPSMAIAQFEADPASPQPTGVKLARGAGVRTQPVDGSPCRYRTCYPVTLWPIDVVDAAIEFPPFDRSLTPPANTAAVLRISLQTHADLMFGELSLDTLRFRLEGDDALMASLYEAMLNKASRVEVRTCEADGRRLLMSASAEQTLHPVGFGDDESLLPTPPQSGKAYQLLTELFAFPEKFGFIDIAGLAGALPNAGRRIDLVIFLEEADERLAREVNAGVFRLGCTPIVNLFEKVCEPIRLTHTKHEYPILPDVHQREIIEVYSVDRVTGVAPGVQTRFAPLYGLNHENSWSGEEEARAFWHTRRRPSQRPDDHGTDLALRLVDLDFKPTMPAEQTVTVHATCTNRGLPRRISASPSALELQMETATPVRSARCLRKPTAPINPPLGAAAYWRLVSHLSLNHLSLTDGRLALPAFQEILRLYDFVDGATNRTRAIANSEMIDGVLSLSAGRTVCRIGDAANGGVCRGIGVELELDEQNFRGVGAFLFGSVLERFFAEYATINSFTRLTLTTKQRGVVKAWSPRSGGIELL
ncbi:hypothetical protein Pla123a_31150 [Posidoniimonas polymericola]|uniref:Type VI secretion system baseplate subunit TssF n=1 Tax=Posidoniimonas polymericola TaxID=2528002 RepID=A0A5C5YL11_9BACT|nr:type VI secretion system baseplate subunit TssF [Posidoniimonas polymericola]TWT75605.1 hypothetical protein Pla123a_31150 [Posidoniimonas polymericola]